jgi:valyl-tRNA synthetase
LPETGGVVRSSGLFDLRIPYAADTIDVAAERARVKKEIEGLQKAITSKENQLGNDTFRSKAPEKIIQQMESALAAQRVELQKLGDRLQQLGE